jgi:hypothetical protein
VDNRLLIPFERIEPEVSVQRFLQRFLFHQHSAKCFRLVAMGFSLGKNGSFSPTLHLFSVT